MTLDYAALAALAAVVRDGSFERAARTLKVTPSAVSQRVRALEERLGSVLLVRSQPVTPTALGAALAGHFERVRLLESELVAALPGVTLADSAVARPTLRIAINADSLGTWFLAAAAPFVAATGALLDLVLDDEARTAERLRSGEVVAAITTDPVPVPGCKIRPLGALRYVATASPAFCQRHFADGVTAATLAAAPVLRFDRRDDLQARWVREALGLVLAAPTHWIPSTQGFLDGTLAGLGWSLNPVSLAKTHLEAGRLIELVPDHPLDVALSWQYARLGAQLLEDLTKTVVTAARGSLRPMGA